MTPASTIVLRPISRAAVAALAAGARPDDVRVAPDYPTEFSRGVGERSAGAGRGIGPFFLHRADDDLVVGEIDGTFVAAGTIEIGCAVVTSCQNRGHATDAVLAFVERARGVALATRVIAHTPLDRRRSARVLEKAGFTFVGDVDDEAEGATILVRRWELVL